MNKKAARPSNEKRGVLSRRASIPPDEVSANLTGKVRRNTLHILRGLPNLNSTKTNNHHGAWSAHNGSSPDRFTTITGEPWYKYKTRPPITNDEKIKSEMCRNLQENGACPYGDDCRFAHHEDELKQIMRHPKHKTQLCRDYHGPAGHCSFGSRCSYIHKQDEPRKKLPVIREKSPNRSTIKENCLFGSSVLHDESDMPSKVVNPSGYHWLESVGLSETDLQLLSVLPSFLAWRLLRKRTDTSDPLSPDISETPSIQMSTPEDVNEKKLSGCDGMLETPRRPTRFSNRPDFECSTPLSPLFRHRGA